MILRFAVSFVFVISWIATAAAQPPTMAQLWPNDDGRSWTYDQHYEDDYDTTVVDNQVRLFFDGTTTAAGGVAAQYLRHGLMSGSAPVLRASASRPGAIRDPLMRAVWNARPDLRARLEQKAAELPCPGTGPEGGTYTLLLGGEFAWLRTATDVSAWRCNLANTRAWQWLASNLTIGSTFTLQLIPDIANNVFLHGTVGAIETANVPAGTFPGCIRVDYVVDYGSTECTDPDGNPLGLYRSETRGYVRYAPDVGPVESFEQFIPNAEGACEPVPIGQPVSLATMKLITMPVPTRPTSWGRLKVAYR